MQFWNFIESENGGRGQKGLENSTNLINTRQEVAKLAGVSDNTIANNGGKP